MKQECEFEKGDIISGFKRGRDEAFHFIVFLDGRDTDSFIGAVLTHSSRYKNNTLMEDGHFEKVTSENKEYKFKFDNTYLVEGRFIKLQDWKPFEKIGKLTNLGVEFLDSKISLKEIMLWDEYIKINQNYEN